MFFVHSEGKGKDSPRSSLRAHWQHLPCQAGRNLKIHPMPRAGTIPLSPGTGVVTQEGLGTLWVLSSGSHISCPISVQIPVVLGLEGVEFRARGAAGSSKRLLC